jgi:hypothetical protein
VGKSSISLLAACVALLIAPAVALAAPADATSTQKYIQADYALVKSAVGKLRTVEGVLAGLRRKIAGECGRAAASAPQNEASTQLSNEVIGAVVITAYDTDLPAGTNFLRAVAGLRWSSHALTRTVQAYAAKLKALKALSVPNVCADLRAWIASGYQTLPASTVRFDQQFMPNWVAIGELPTSLLAPSVRPGERATLHNAGQLESQLTDFEAAVGVSTWEEIMNALVLQP